MNSGDFKRIEDRETAINPRAYDVDPISMRPQEDLKNYDPLVDHVGFYPNIDRQKALGFK